LSVLGMRALGCDNISYLVPNRFEDGYGLSPEVVDQAKARGAQGRHNGGIGLAGVGNRLIIFLLADIFCADQWNIAFDRQVRDSR
ncbi:hypothetical protein MJN76_30110, partial [Salmonella enterica subsp. enterica serovar Anatum]|nr:hypothetical protein [Salmonella enterica subsp. enterica serovar Anatum]